MRFNVIVAFGGIVVGLVIAWACGPQSTSATAAYAQVDPVTDTSASTTEPAALPSAPTVVVPPPFAAQPCLQWEVAATPYFTNFGPMQSHAQRVVLPEGSEPFGTAVLGNEITVVSRRCIKKVKPAP